MCFRWCVCFDRVGTLIRRGNHKTIDMYVFQDGLMPDIDPLCWFIWSSLCINNDSGCLLGESFSFFNNLGQKQLVCSHTQLAWTFSHLLWHRFDFFHNIKWKRTQSLNLWKLNLGQFHMWFEIWHLHFLNAASF